MNNNKEQEKQKWLVLEDDGCVHVVPETDSKPHGFPKGKTAELSDTDCPCKPKVDFSGRKPMVVHNSFDDMERINEALSNPKTNANQ